VELDGTLYEPRPVEYARHVVVLLGGADVRTLRRFRAAHEHLRASQTRPVASPYRMQLEQTAAALGLEPARVEAQVRQWMIERPGKWLRRFRRRALIAELTRFRANGGRLALVSDYPASRKLEALGCRSLFDAIVANGEDGGPEWLKPHPDGLLKASTRLGVGPERCLVLGDRADADGEAARRAGMAFRKIG
jgi:HAD superfamily hydrolase (TIGR01549 family)